MTRRLCSGQKRLMLYTNEQVPKLTTEWSNSFKPLPCVSFLNSLLPDLCITRSDWKEDPRRSDSAVIFKYIHKAHTTISSFDLPK